MCETEIFFHFNCVTEDNLFWCPSMRPARVRFLESPETLRVTQSSLYLESDGVPRHETSFILIFLPFTSCEKTSPTEQAGRIFTNGLSDPKGFRDFRETGRRTEMNLESESMWLKNGTAVLNINFGKTLLKTRNFSISWLFLMYNKKTRYH